MMLPDAKLRLLTFDHHRSPLGGSDPIHACASEPGTKSLSEAFGQCITSMTYTQTIRYIFCSYNTCNLVCLPVTLMI